MRHEKVKISDVRKILLGELNYMFKDIGDQKLLLSFLDSIVQEERCSFAEMMSFVALLHKLCSATQALKERDTIIEKLMSNLDRIIKFWTYSLSDVFNVADEDLKVFYFDGQDKDVVLNVARSFINNIGLSIEES